MERSRSRSKRYYYESETLHSRSKLRHYYGGGRKMQDSSLMVTTSYRILCHDVKAGGVIGKSGSIVKAIRQHTGAWINVNELIAGDEERIIEISDTRRRDPEGRIPAFSPAQEALLLIHERILESENGDGEYGGRGGGGRVVTRLVVSQAHVGCLLGKGGKIIEQIRIETKTHIRILPRDHTLPRCVAMSEEIVQVVGNVNAVKSAMEIISSRLRESQHRDRTQFHNRLQSPDRYFPRDDDFHMNSSSRRSSVEGPSFGSRYSNGSRSSIYASRLSGFTTEDNAQSFSGEDLVFRILCPVDKIDNVLGESGIVDLLQNEIGVNVDVSDPVTGSDELIIIISSDEGPDDELFPAQEALLHIQTHIADLVPEKENIIMTRLLLPSDEVDCLIELGKIGGAKVEILPREEFPVGLSRTDEIVQIVGEVKAARMALVEVTSRIRSNICREFLDKGIPVPHASAPTPAEAAAGSEVASRSNMAASVETYSGNGPASSTLQGLSTAAAPQKLKDTEPTNVEPTKQLDNERREEQPSGLNRIVVPLVTRSTLEVVIPPHVAAEFVKKSRKLALISELSGANVKLMDDRPETIEKVIQIAGTPEQAAKASEFASRVHFKH